eukprot:5793583-Pyramimonas_sp.AAC.1
MTRTIRIVSRTEFGQQTEFGALDSTSERDSYLRIDSCDYEPCSPPKVQRTDSTSQVDSKNTNSSAILDRAADRV